MCALGSSKDPTWIQGGSFDLVSQEGADGLSHTSHLTHNSHTHTMEELRNYGITPYTHTRTGTYVYICTRRLLAHCTLGSN